MIASAYVVGKREHMNLRILVHRCSPINQIRLGIISELIIFVFVLLVLGYGGGYIAVNAMVQMDSALPVPVGVVYLALPVGGVLAAIYSLCNIADFIKSIHTYLFLSERSRTEILIGVPKKPNASRSLFSIYLL